MAEAIGYEKRKARKKHQCWWCAEPIEPGTTYARWGWPDEGTVTEIKVHTECGDAWDSLHWADAEAVGFGCYTRGCTCENGRCECEKKEADNAE